MRVFKFGGASVKDAESIRNVAHVLKVAGHTDTFMVLSAMGKTTNALETVVEQYMAKGDYAAVIKNIKQSHLDISNELFESDDLIRNQVALEIDSFFNDLTYFLSKNKSPHYNYIYDQVVSCGELISTKIVSAYLNGIGLTNQWLDVRDYIKTDSTYREGQIQWDASESNLSKLEPNNFYITQGFLGSDDNGFTVTLGREGSDYTAAIVAYCLNAESMSIWKDVPGVLNADPRYFNNAQLLHHISYTEAIELAYYGASVIHPKTMQPLQRKSIPFYVKSFIDPTASGTSIKEGQPLDPHLPCYILKKNQTLVTLSRKDFSFIDEGHLSELFQLLTQLRIKTSLMQISAIELFLCLEDTYMALDNFIAQCADLYHIQSVPNVNLYTVRHFTPEAELDITQGKNILLRQIIKDTLQVVSPS